MALDEAIAFAVRKDIVPPTLRFYGWKMPSVSLGCFQKVSDIDIEYCNGENIPVVRRPTGGRAILHRDEITYSFSVKTTSGFFSKGLLDSYKKISSALCLALSKSGVSPELKLKKEPRHPLFDNQTKSPMCFQSVSYGEISVNDRKVIGSAQKRWTDGLLQQGSVPFIVDENVAMKIFRLDSAYLGNKWLTGLKELVPGLNHNRLKEHIRTSFEEVFQIKLISSGPSEGEIKLAQELEPEKYKSFEWNFRR